MASRTISLRCTNQPIINKSPLVSLGGQWPFVREFVCPSWHVFGTVWEQYVRTFQTNRFPLIPFPKPVNVGTNIGRTVSYNLFVKLGLSKWEALRSLAFCMRLRWCQQHWTGRAPARCCNMRQFRAILHWDEQKKVTICIFVRFSLLSHSEICTRMICF